MLERRFEYRAARGTPPTVASAKSANETSDRRELVGRPLTNQDVLKLKEAGLSDELLIAKIKLFSSSIQFGNQRSDRPENRQGFGNRDYCNDRSAGAAEVRLSSVR